MTPHASHRFAFRIGAVMSAAGCLSTLLWTAIPAGHAVSRFGSPVVDSWPAPLSNPVTPSIVMFALTLLSLVVAVWPVRLLRKIWATSLLFGVAFCSLHVVTLNKAEFFGGLFAALWWHWFVYTESTDPERLRQDGPRLATFVLMGTFLPAALGKTVSSHSALLIVRTYGLPALLLDAPLPESLRPALMWLVVCVEGLLGLAPVLPLRAMLWSALAVVGGMFVWDMYLLPALLPVASVAAASLILLRSAEPQPEHPVETI